MSLVPDYDDSSNSSASSDSSSTTDEDSARKILTRGTENNIPEEIKPKLPAPDFVFNRNKEEATKTSVFTNHYIEAENAKDAMLQKHVKMVENKQQVAIINGKKICWNYRKGRCRFGHNCKYAHDSDIQKSNEQLEKEQEIQQTVLFQSKNLPTPSAQELEHIKEESLQNQHKRKRPGLSQGLVPGKKVMKSYFNQKN